MKIDRKRVDALMAQRGIPRYKDLAERAGLTQKRLSVILNHGSGRPKTIIKVAKALGVFAPDLSGERRDTLKPYGLPTLEEIQAAHSPAPPAIHPRLSGPENPLKLGGLEHRGAAEILGGASHGGGPCGP